MSIHLVELNLLHTFSAGQIKLLLKNDKIKKAVIAKSPSKKIIFDTIKQLLETTCTRLKIPTECIDIYKKFTQGDELYIILDKIRDFDDLDGDNDDGSAASSTNKTNSAPLTMEDCLRGKSGICYYLPNAPKNSEQLCAMYGNFSSLVASLVKNIDYILRQFDDEIESVWKLKGFTIGKTNTQGYKKRHFSTYNVNTWRKRGIKNRWGREPYNNGKDDFKVMVVLAGFTLNWLRVCGYIDNTARAGDQHNFALAVEQSLTTYYLYQRKDKRVTNFTSESGQGMAKGICGIVYVSLQLEPQQFDNNANHDDNEVVNDNDANNVIVNLETNGIDKSQDGFSSKIEETPSTCLII